VTAACNEALGQSVTSEVKDFHPLSNGTAQRRISDMTDDTETKLTEIKKSVDELTDEDWCLLGCYAAWLL
jgi:hypothetical protein